MTQDPMLKQKYMQLITRLDGQMMSTDPRDPKQLKLYSQLEPIKKMLVDSLNYPSQATLDAAWAKYNAVLEELYKQMG